MEFDSSGISVGSVSRNAPTNNRVSVYNNSFANRRRDSASAISIGSSPPAPRASHTPSIVRNSFQLLGSDSAAVFVSDVDSGVFSGNRVRGTGAFGILIDAFDFSASVTGWSIVDNIFASFPTFEDIYLGPSTVDNIVGPQSAFVASDGFNFVLSGQPFFDKETMEEQLERALKVKDLGLSVSEQLRTIR
jgi:hypothetical protein